MSEGRILEVVRRELQALGQYYRNDWSGFDGRTLLLQLISLNEWTREAQTGEGVEEFTSFSEDLKEQQEGGVG